MNPRSSMPRAALLLVAAAACAPAASPEPEPRPSRVPEPSEQMLESAAADFEDLRAGFLEWYYPAHPVRATELGMHAADGSLPSYEAVAVQARIDRILAWLSDLEDVPFRLMRGDDRYDYALLEYALRAELLELEEVQRWRRDARLYTGRVARGLAAVAEREYAPVAERLEALRSRMEAAPALLEAGRDNLRRPPRRWTELALAETRGLVTYVEEELPAVLAAQGAEAGALAGARARLVEALDEHAAWLEDELLPRSDGDDRLGRFLLERLLLYQEHLSLSADELAELNDDAIEELRAEAGRVARRIDPSRTPREIMDSIASVHPAPGALLDTTRAMVRTARDRVEAAGLVTLLDQRLPTVRGMPPYDRADYASLQPPGPFDSAELPTYFNLATVPDGWGEEQARQHMTYFNYPSLLGITMRETFPGHHVQAGYLRTIESELRRVFTPRSFVAGWAYYAEQLALERGLGGDDPILQLARVQRALEHHARWYAALRLHADNAPFEEVVEGFMEIANFAEVPARREVMRATFDPTYLADALGRMQIVELREDYRAYLEEQDREFTLREFHDQILQLALPIPLAREVLIPRPRGPREISRP